MEENNLLTLYINTVTNSFLRRLSERGNKVTVVNDGE